MDETRESVRYLGVMKPAGTRLDTTGGQRSGVRPGQASLRTQLGHRRVYFGEPLEAQMSEVGCGDIAAQLVRWCPRKPSTMDPRMADPLWQGRAGQGVTEDR